MNMTDETEVKEAIVDQRESAKPVPPKPPAVELPLEGVELSTEALCRLKKRLNDSVESHDGWTDPVMFNLGTIVVLALTGFATFLPTIPAAGQYPWAAPLCTALAGLLIAMERALGWGARWRFQKEMKNAYVAIVDMLEFLPLLPPSERAKYARDIFAALYAARSRESAIPNAGTNVAPT